MLKIKVFLFLKVSILTGKVNNLFEEGGGYVENQIKILFPFVSDPYSSWLFCYRQSCLPHVWSYFR